MKKVILSVLFFAPVVSFAAVLGNIRGIIDAIGNIVSSIIPIVFALILVYFFWGLMRFVANASDEDARASGRQMMIWGIVALFVASSVWGLTKFVGQALGIDQNIGSVSVPTVGN
jgi:drug/metabolite transporter (DMT)-like permease